MIKLLTTTTILLIATQTQAAWITYTNKTTYKQTAKPHYLESFETPPTNPSMDFGQYPHFSIIGGGHATGSSDGHHPTHGINYWVWGPGTSANGQIIINFTKPVKTVGFSIIDFGDVRTAPGTLTAKDNRGNTRTLATNPTRLPNGNEIFFGFTTPPITQLTISATTFPGDGIDIDEIYFTTVPEPQTTTLLIMTAVVFFLWTNNSHCNSENGNLEHNRIPESQRGT